MGKKCIVVSEVRKGKFEVIVKSAIHLYGGMVSYSCSRLCGTREYSVVRPDGKARSCVCVLAGDDALSGRPILKARSSEIFRLVPYRLVYRNSSQILQAFQVLTLDDFALTGIQPVLPKFIESFQAFRVLTLDDFALAWIQSVLPKFTESLQVLFDLDLG